MDINEDDMNLTYIIKKSRRRSISVTITKKCEVLVKAPYGINEEYVHKFLNSKHSWIVKHIESQQQQNEKVCSLGKFSASQIAEMKKQARKIIPERVDYYAKIAGITYKRIFIRLQKTRWGSCSNDGNLNFNCLLVMMPSEVLDSVVVHELIHRHHMNHSKAFYDEVISLFPEYKKWDKWLRVNGGIYQARVPDA